MIKIVTLAFNPSVVARAFSKVDPEALGKGSEQNRGATHRGRRRLGFLYDCHLDVTSVFHNF